MQCTHNLITYGKSVLTNRQYFWHLYWFVLLGELILGCLIIQFLDTEIDWKAYMNEVHDTLSKSLDYADIRGETGPLVYPGGFVYVFSFLYKITNEGENIRFAQYIFLGLYLLTLSIVMILYNKSEAVPQWSVLLLCLSKRIKSIYYLRLFNEAVTMLPMYIAMCLLFTNQQWFFGVVLVSIALSMKMNILLFFPSLLLLLFESVGVVRSIFLMGVVILVQFIVGMPFLAENAGSYINRAYEFGRVFTYKWTVNYKFLSYEIFVNPIFGRILLIIQLTVLLLFIFCRWSQPMGGIWRVVQSDPLSNKPRNLVVRIFDWFIIRENAIHLTSEHILTTLFTGNFIGIVFSRSLHTQYYCWYFHSVPYLMWRTSMPVFAKFILSLTFEIVYNIYPSTPASSALLLVSHWILLICLWMRKSDISIKKDKME